MYKTYSELSKIESFIDRFNYLKIGGIVGRETFGFDRYLNQSFYTSRKWRNIRNHIITRDDGCDLGIQGREIHDKIIIHHINPLSVDDIIHERGATLDPDNLITVSASTHNAIHFGNEDLLQKEWLPRRLGDTTLW